MSLVTCNSATLSWGSASVNGVSKSGVACQGKGVGAKEACQQIWVSCRGYSDSRADKALISWKSAGITRAPNTLSSVCQKSDRRGLHQRPSKSGASFAQDGIAFPHRLHLQPPRLTSNPYPASALSLSNGNGKRLQAVHRCARGFLRHLPGPPSLQPGSLFQTPLVARGLVADLEFAMAAPKMTKNQMRRAKKKEQKKAQVEVRAPCTCFPLCARLTDAP